MPDGLDDVASTSDGQPAVRRHHRQTQGTFFMQVVGQATFTAAADATAQIGRPAGTSWRRSSSAATAPGHSPPVLLPDAHALTGFKVNDLAKGVKYDIFGNDIKDQGRDCGNPSSSFRGLVNTVGTYPLPGDWDTDTGNTNGPTVRLVNSGNACSTTGDPDDLTVGCMLVIPLCPRSNGQRWHQLPHLLRRPRALRGLSVANHDIDAIFRGRPRSTTGASWVPLTPTARGSSR